VGEEKKDLEATRGGVYGVGAKEPAVPSQRARQEETCTLRRAEKTDSRGFARDADSRRVEGLSCYVS
jgi:hypothetical protein